MPGELAAAAASCFWFSAVDDRKSKSCRYTGLLRVNCLYIARDRRVGGRRTIANEVQEAGVCGPIACILGDTVAAARCTAYLPGDGDAKSGAAAAVSESIADDGCAAVHQQPTAHVQYVMLPARPRPRPTLDNRTTTLPTCSPWPHPRATCDRPLIKIDWY